MTPVIDSDALNELVRRIRAVVKPVRIILFGSVAKGKVGPDSDIDVLVVVPDGEKCRQTAQTIYRNLLGFGIATDVVVATPMILKEYGESSAFVYRQALAEGRELFRAAA